MKKILVLTLLVISLMLAGCAEGFVIMTPDEPVSTGETTEYKQTEGITVVPSLKDEVTADSAWCATFQLVWNDLKNEYVKQDVEFAIPNQMMENLNEETFTEDMLSDEYYYKIWGKKTLEMKEKIEKGIKEKFNETSDLLDKVDWENVDSEDCERMIFYTMLRRDFEYPKEFTKLPEGNFGDEYENVKYFGINGSSNEQLDGQVDVLFYNSDEEYAVSLQTKNGDEVILYKNPAGKTFEEIYANLTDKADAYKGEKVFAEIDQLKVPYVKMNELREYYELCGNPFLTADGKEIVIDQAMQTIKFEIDEKGGKIKSEAVIATKENAMIMPDEEEPRYFYFDDTFAMFLKEESKDMPYFGILIDDITKYQAQ